MRRVAQAHTHPPRSRLRVGACADRVARAQPTQHRCVRSWRGVDGPTAAHGGRPVCASPQRQHSPHFPAAQLRRLTRGEPDSGAAPG
eukprot:scaffold869_cov105-Isochrysis_galbana.AAC.2